MHDAILDFNMAVFLNKLGGLYRSCREEVILRIQAREAQAQAEIADSTLEIGWFGESSENEDKEEDEDIAS